MRLKSLLLSCLLFLGITHANAQSKKDTASISEENDLMSMLNADAPTTQNNFSTATFKTTRIGNSQSIENVAKGVLDFRISHRFGTLNQGAIDLFGLDMASMRFGLDYGISKRLMVGIGRSSYLKEYDGFIKFKLLRQTDDNKMPISISYCGDISAQTNKVTLPDYEVGNRIAYMNQLLIAKKFSPKVSFQIMPTHIHYNVVNTNKEPNDIMAVGVGGRVKITNRVSLTGEYFYQLNQLDNTTNSLTIGIDIETGGHVFQLIFTNSTGITERNVIGETTGKWSAGDIHFGFNISRVFTVVKPKGFENSRTKIW